MMPTLPGKDLSQEHFDRVVAAFEGDTLAEKAASYDAWLTNNLIDHVERVEAERLQLQYAQQLSDALDALRASLPPRVERVRDLTPPPIVQPPA
jgi:hypothetical protein